MRKKSKTKEQKGLSFINPHCSTRSALDKNFIANAISKNPKTTFTEFNQPPDFGKDFSHVGNLA